MGVGDPNMIFPKTIDLPLGELERAKTIEDLKRVLRGFMLEIRTMHEKAFEDLKNLGP